MAEEFSPSGVPIIDLSFHDTNIIARHVEKACVDAGCFYVKNHGVELKLIENTLSDLRAFFNDQLDYKTRFLDPNKNVDRGYHLFATQNVNAFMGRFGLPNDPVEKISFGPPGEFSRPILENVYPDFPVTLKKNVRAANAPSENYFYDRCKEGEHIFKANFYPKRSAEDQETRFAEHTDSTPFTILAMDDCPESLQMKNSSGVWVYADPIPGTFFVNLGNVLAMWTNDRWKATVHKVVWPPENRERLSLVYFVVMNPKSVVECLHSCLEPQEEPKYPPISYEDYVKARMDRLEGKY